MKVKQLGVYYTEIVGQEHVIEYNNTTASCSFTSTGIKDKLKNLMDNVSLGLGTIDGTTSFFHNVSTVKAYEFERSTNTGKICDGKYQGGVYCTDTVERTTTWIGKVGLMYPSDYGYAISNENAIDSSKCLNVAMRSWESNWLTNDDEFTLTPSSRTEFDYDIFCIHNKVIDSNSAKVSLNVRPVVYLKSSVKITSGDGSSSNPCILGL